MRLLILRHGATAGNEAHRYVGRGTDEPLSPVGRAQCQRVDCHDKPDTVFVSPLLRARETAGICFPHARQVVVAGLEEMDFGAFEDRTADEMADDPAYRAWVEGGCLGRCPGGESFATFARRSNAALEGILRSCVERSDPELVVVAHGGTIMAALSSFAAGRASRGPTNPFVWHARPCEGYVAQVELAFGGVVLRDPHRYPQEC